MASTSTTKDLQVHSVYGSCTVQVSSADTLSDVRATILNRYSNDMLPPNSTDFIMFVGEKVKPIWRFKEPTTKAWNVISNADWGFVTLDVYDARKRISSATDDDEHPAQKRPKAAEDRPAQSLKGTEDDNESQEVDDHYDHGKESKHPHIPPDEKNVQAFSFAAPVRVFTHPTYDRAMSESSTVLKELDKILNHPGNTLFCSEGHRKELSAEIKVALEAKAYPDTIIGCLGATGVGKSSLLNALLDEADVLPTSGSRGCTAAVVELRFNLDLLEGKDQTTVYKGQVEFISLQDWHSELKILLDECCTHDAQKVYSNAPQEQHSPEAAAAWAKINQVYGRGAMASYAGKPKAEVWDSLSTDPRVASLLTGENEQANTILVKEGVVDADQSKLLCGSLSGLKGKLGRMQKKWAKAFRTKINDYVYRKGNGREPQTWPLIRKVVLNGPWSVLATGACLVDLPGVRDANAARARVAQNYLQNCHQIWVVAPIKRAVDDGTAKELLGDNFKRRLLMDGQYGNVSFICTQTDDCETTEIMRDHEDVARKVEGRWERMVNLRDQIIGIDTERNEVVLQEDDLKVELEETQQEIKDLKEEMSEIKADQKNNAIVYLDENGEEEDGPAQVLKALKDSLQAKEQRASGILDKLQAHRQGSKEQIQKLEETSASLQRTLKSIAALVRNEYSTNSLQDDFRVGLEELTRGPDEEDMDENTTPEDTTTPPTLPDDFQLEVHCIASNDYLKLQGVKPASDGLPNTFDNAQDTGILSLRSAVHATTAQFRAPFAANFVNSTSNMLDRFMLCATENIEDTASGHRFRQVFEKEMKVLESKITPIVSEFTCKAEQKFNSALHPSLKNGAAKGTEAAMATVMSWWATRRRTKHERSSKQNGLHWATYNATIRRDGSYVSAKAGEIDFNQELCDPVEKEFSMDWQRSMDGAIKVFLAESEEMVRRVVASISMNVVNALVDAGMDTQRVESMAATANRTSATAIQAAFQAVRQLASNSQRNLNRSLLPKVTERMSPGYFSAVNVPGGIGKFQRMRDKVSHHTHRALQTMFQEATLELQRAIDDFIKQIASMIQDMAELVNKSFSSVYSMSWDQRKNWIVLDPVMQEKIQACRNRLLPDLMLLQEGKKKSMALLDIEQEVADTIGIACEARKAKEMIAAPNVTAIFKVNHA